MDFPFSQLTWQEAVQWVQKTYDVQPRTYLAADEVTNYLKWEQGTRRYTVMVATDELIDGVAVSHEQNPPIVQEVLTCFGEPGFYEAFYDPTPDGPTYTTLQLWYPERGLVFYGSVPSPLAAVDRRMPMRLVTYFEPNSQVNNEALMSWKLWPGDVEKVVIDESRMAITDFLVSHDADYVRGTAVHELAHVIDFWGRVTVSGSSGRDNTLWPSLLFPGGTCITDYAMIGGPTEYWAEAVTDWVYGGRYKGPYVLRP